MREHAADDFILEREKGKSVIVTIFLKLLSMLKRPACAATAGGYPMVRISRDFRNHIHAEHPHSLGIWPL